MNWFQDYMACIVQKGPLSTKATLQSFQNLAGHRSAAVATLTTNPKTLMEAATSVK